MYYNDNSLTLKSFLFGGVKLNKNPDPDKYSCFGYSISFHVRGTFLLSSGGFGKNVVIFGAYMSSSVHVDNEKKDIFILGKDQRQELDDTNLTTKAKCSVNFTKQDKSFICITLEATAVYLLILQKHINSKQAILK